MSDPSSSDPRRLMHAQNTAALGTLMAGAPYVSLVLVAFDADGSPLLLLSRLAQHTKNLLSDPRLSLLFEDAAGLDDPLTGPRMTVIGTAAPCPDARALERYLARHPSAQTYAGFSDFTLWKVSIERGHSVAGFGKIQWIEADAFLE
jgi:putative heme iron utilization protein